MGIGTLRRYHKLKAEAAAGRGDLGQAGALTAKHEADEGTPLPDDFPARDLLEAAKYTTIEDLDGATGDELAKVKGITLTQVAQVLAAVAALKAPPAG